MIKPLCGDKIITSLLKTVKEVLSVTAQLRKPWYLQLELCRDSGCRLICTEDICEYKMCFYVIEV